MISFSGANCNEKGKEVYENDKFLARHSVSYTK
jgi:hypothetical protein